VPLHSRLAIPASDHGIWSRLATGFELPNSKLGNLLCRICEQAEKLGLLIEHEQLTATLVPTMRKPFDVVAEGLLVQSSRGDKI
jgi:hypothetical protein